MKQSNDPINIPNIISIARILVTPVFILLLIEQLFFQAFLIFAMAAISDGVDGFIARHFNQRTELGAYLDPIADKLLLTSAFIGLAILQIIPSWLTIIVITRDIIILLGIVFFILTKIDFTIKPRIISKFTTVAQLATILLSLLRNNSHDTTQIVIMGITTGLTVISGIHYIFIGFRILQDNGGKTDP